jgi:hypothetical protein
MPRQRTCCVLSAVTYLLCVGGASAVRASQAQAGLRTERPALTGEILSSTGRRVGKARISIYAASVKKGYSQFCPTCYADCAKSSLANTHGGFRIASLDPNLRFRVLVVADGYAPSFTDHVDPAAGPVKITLKPRSLRLTAPAHLVRGVVVGIGGLPVAGALVEPFGRTTPQGEMFADASYLGLDPLAISDSKGQFELYSQQANAHYFATVKARGLATQITKELTAGGQPLRISLNSGVSIYGRIVRMGKPMPAIPVGLVQVNRNCETFVGNSEIATDRQGRFLFTNITPNIDYYVYGLMGGGGRTAVTTARRIHAGKDGTVFDAGDITVSPLHRVVGQVILTDGKPVPSMTRILITRQGTWDSETVTTDSQGRFTVDALPDETLDFLAAVRDYQFADGSTGLDPNADSPQNGTYFRRSVHITPNMTVLTLKMQPMRAGKK